MRRASFPRIPSAAAVIALAGSLCAYAEESPVQFVDRAPDQAFEHTYTGGWEHFVGGGVAAFDCNGDDFLDLYVAGGTTAAKLLVNAGDGVGPPLAFNHKPGEVTDRLGVIGAYPLDIDSDDILDLVVLRVGENLLLRGLGECTFAQANEAWGFTSADRWTTAFSATWEPGAEWPTLAFGNYVDRTDPDIGCDVNVVYRPASAGYEAPLELMPSRCPLSMLFIDWDGSGRADLRVSNDRHYYGQEGQEQLWRFDGPPRLYSAADGWQPLKIWGMGIAGRDLFGDSRPEFFLTSMGDQKLRSLAEDAAGPTFVDSAFGLGVTAHVPHTGPNDRPSTGWHPAFGDVDNDGRDDLFISKGNVNAMPGAAADDPNNLLIQQKDGRFREYSERAGVASTARSRGAALADLNLDGKLDLVVVNRHAGLEIHENVTSVPGNWLAVDVRQPAPNRRAIGGRIEVTDGEHSWYRQLTVGGGHASGTASPEHFGLGTAQEVRLRVRWPDGTESPWQTAAANQRVLISR